MTEPGNNPSNSWTAAHVTVTETELKATQYCKSVYAHIHTVYGGVCVANKLYTHTLDIERFEFRFQFHSQFKL